MKDPYGLSLKIDASKAQAKLAQFGARNVGMAMAQAANDTARQTAAEAAKVVARISGLRSKEARKTFVIRKATPDVPNATFRIGYRPLGLIEYVAGRKPPKRKPKKGIRARPFRKSRVYAGTFTIKTKRGYQVFKRTGKDRLPIERMYGPGAAQVAKMPKVWAGLQAFADLRLWINLDRQIDRRFRAVTRKFKARR